ncbi:hypothetical protein D9758_001263 [Tetrapyrgos nigripes]|uniref:F-box domain-containing protein n=1 Tax=Tetrapyrgos nigripes TaxID=182062 RepID=A0A8H5GS91_9AGAR|nr:hypothetical protein D9758_001263 [Tetrapyrgos nigripes]
MSLNRLPPEIHDILCLHLPSSHLAALSLSCSHFYNIVQRHLYRDIHITPAFHNLAVVPTLAAKPALARHVRSFSISLASQSSVLLAYYRQLARALSHMTGLSSLSLFVDPSASWVLRGVQAKWLAAFACSFPFDSHVAAFLKTTPALLRLEVDPESQAYFNPEDASIIPHLEQFRGSSQVAQAIVPGRPVHSVFITSGELTDVVAHLADSVSNVSILEATISSSPAPLLHLISERLPHVTHLRITYNSSEAPDTAFYEDVGSALDAFPRLQTFEFSGMHWGSLKNNEISSEQNSSELQQTDAPSFETIDVDIDSEFFTDY